MALFLDQFSEQVEALYIAYFGRAAEPDGFEYWVGRLQSGQMSFAQVAASFSQQPEATAQHPFLNSPTSSGQLNFIESLYAQLLNRQPDAEGLAYWTQALTSAGNDPIKLGLLIAQFISGANVANGDAAIIQNKIDAALYSTKALDDAGIGGTTNGSTLDPKYAAILRDVVDNEVTKEAATIQISKIEIDEFLNPKPNPSGGSSNPPPQEPGPDPDPEPVGDASISIGADAASTMEKSADQPAVATFTVSRSGNTNVAVTLDYIVSGYGENAAIASDFIGNEFPSGTVTFAVGETEKTISVTIAQDSLREGSEGFQVSLSTTQSGVAFTAIVAASSIVDNPFEYLGINSHEAQTSDDGDKILFLEQDSGSGLRFMDGQQSVVLYDGVTPGYALSNDGSAVLYYDSNDGLTLRILRGGAETALSIDFEIQTVSVSDDGSTAVIIGYEPRSDSFNAYQWRSESGDLQNITQQGNGRTYASLVSGDGSTIVAATYDNINDDPDYLGFASDLFYRSVDGPEWTQITHTLYSNEDLRGISDDGQSLLYSESYGYRGSATADLWLFNAASSTSIQIFDGRNVRADRQNITDAEISADGSTVVYSVQQLEDGVFSRSGEVYRYDVASGVTTNITSFTDLPAFNVTISNDGSRIFYDLIDYAARIEANGDRSLMTDISDVYAYDVTTGLSTNITAAGNHYSYGPEVAGDGSKLLFNTFATNFGNGAGGSGDLLSPFLVSYDL